MSNTNIYLEAEKYLEEHEDSEGSISIYHALRALRLLEKSIRERDKVLYTNGENIVVKPY